MQDLGSSRAMLEIQYENEVPLACVIILLSTVKNICLHFSLYLLPGRHWAWSHSGVLCACVSGASAG